MELNAAGDALMKLPVFDHTINSTSQRELLNSRVVPHLSGVIVDQSRHTTKRSLNSVTRFHSGISIEGSLGVFNFH